MIHRSPLPAPELPGMFTSAAQYAIESVFAELDEVGQS